MTFSNIILFLTALCSALMAGLFYAFTCSVTVGLKLLPNAEYLAAMQAINRSIQNPLFFICFFGILLLLPLCTYLQFSAPISTQFWLMLFASIIYFAGVFATTIFGNIPLNNALEKFSLLNASTDAINLQRSLFEIKWNTLNTIRTISSIASLSLIIIACINANKNG
jgi:uncharacterized membrane protein